MPPLLYAQARGSPSRTRKPSSRRHHHHQLHSCARWQRTASINFTCKHTSTEPAPSPPRIPDPPRHSKEGVGAIPAFYHQGERRIMADINGGRSKTRRKLESRVEVGPFGALEVDNGGRGEDLQSCSLLLSLGGRCFGDRTRGLQILGARDSLARSLPHPRLWNWDLKQTRLKHKPLVQRNSIYRIDRIGTVQPRRRWGKG
jgi:hypothetical protein